MSESVEHLVQMANDIGNFFRAEPRREDAIAGIAGHINRFWTRRMRQKLLEAVAHGEKGLDELPQAALANVVTAPAQSAPPASTRASTSSPSGAPAAQQK
ncbi:MAG TPA: formate dehydrogenase subunit delta [Steroidobacteraceae bacterium]|nr:formate dehydrogenase subunit delta [Steroidobacteraceae bacterium]